MIYLQACWAGVFLLAFKLGTRVHKLPADFGYE